MKSLKQRQHEELSRIIASQPRWVPNDVVDYGDGDIDFRPPDEFQWDVPGDQTSYVISIENDDTWIVSWFTAGPDHGIIADGELGSFKTASEARAAAYRHAADSIAAELHADAKIYGDPDEPTFTVKIPGAVWDRLTHEYCVDAADAGRREQFDSMPVLFRRIGRGYQAEVTGTVDQWGLVARYVASITELLESMTTEERGDDKPAVWRNTVAQISVATGVDWFEEVRK